jgi:hypothetical protein
VAPPEFYIESIRTAEPGQRPGEFTVQPGHTIELIVALSSQPAGVAGKVSTRDGKPAIGAPVYLHAIDPELCSRLNGSRSTRADHAGEFRFAGLPPGKYQVFGSFEIREPGEDDWGRLPVSVISLGENEKATIDLELLGDL